MIFFFLTIRQPQRSTQSRSSAASDVYKRQTRDIAFGRLYATRSGDKGGCANMGVWGNTDASYEFLCRFLTVDKFKELLPDTKPFAIDRYQMRNLKALNFYIHGILGEGVSSNSRLDPQAKTLGEYLRSKVVPVPVSLLGAEGSIPASYLDRHKPSQWRGTLAKL
eukprot:TRINITY_DN24136_c0_g1_i1.p1 TRINITY_DN24136_c0_g1~~TRINITY_DN24136_c0_g1_i1.p1  ORF type:complete len:165 (-),score=44.58 TRINITY_DN24136_c0_g1_i1:318-812(-)